MTVIVDSDMHVMEPADLWTSAGIPIEGWGWNGVIVEGQRVPDAPTEWFVDTEAYKGGPASQYAEAAKDGFGWKSTVAACDREGIGIAVLLPTRGLGLIGVDGVDPILLDRAARHYNLWITRYCGAARGRLTSLALVSLHDVSLACMAVAAAKRYGHLGVVTRPNPVNGRTLDHPDLDPFYSQLEQEGLPLVLHEGTGARQPTLGLDRSLTYLAAHAMSHPFEQMAAVLHCTVGGVFARHPRLRVGFFEAGCGWLPWWLDRLDDHALGLFGSREYKWEQRPSFYFKRQGFVTMEPEEDLFAIPNGLRSRVLFASDYPHGDSHFPHSVREARRSASEKLWPDVSCHNAHAFYDR